MHSFVAKTLKEIFAGSIYVIAISAHAEDPDLHERYRITWLENNAVLDLTAASPVPFPSWLPASTNQDGEDGKDAATHVFVGQENLYIKRSFTARGQDGQPGGDGDHTGYNDLNAGNGGQAGRGGALSISANHIHKLESLVEPLTFDVSGGKGGSGGRGSAPLRCGTQGGNGGDGGNGGKPGKISLKGIINNCNPLNILSTGGKGGDSGQAGQSEISGMVSTEETIGIHGTAGITYHCDGYPSSPASGIPDIENVWRIECDLTGWAEIDLPGTPDGLYVENCTELSYGSCHNLGIPQLPPPPFTGVWDIDDVPVSNSPPPYWDPNQPTPDGVPGDPGKQLPAPSPNETLPTTCTGALGDVLTNPEFLNCNTTVTGWMISGTTTTPCTYGADISFQGETAAQSLWRDRVWEIQPVIDTYVTLTGFSHYSPYMMVVMKSDTITPVAEICSYGGFPAQISFIADGSPYYVVYQTWSPVADYWLSMTCVPVTYAEGFIGIYNMYRNTYVNLFPQNGPYDTGYVKVMRDSYDLSEFATCRFFTQDGTALAGVDYTPINTTVIFEPYQTEKFIKIRTNPNGQPSGKYLVVDVDDFSTGTESLDEVLLGGTSHGPAFLLDFE